MKISALYTLIFIISSASFGKTPHYQVDVEVLVDGQIVSSPKILTISGVPAEASQEDEAGLKNKVKISVSDYVNEDAPAPGYLSLLITAQSRVGEKFMELASTIQSVRSGEEFTALSRMGTETGGTHTLIVRGTATRVR